MNIQTNGKLANMITFYVPPYPNNDYYRCPFKRQLTCCLNGNVTWPLLLSQSGIYAIVRYLLLHWKALAGVVKSNLSLIVGGSMHLAMPGST